VLTISGERKSELPPQEAKATVHIDERFAGRFRRVVTLPDDADPNAVQASYRDGVLNVSIQRVEAALPRRIAVQ
jgi:HSP20 family protein